MMLRRATTFALALVLGVGSFVGCAINPATGKRQIALISEAQEIEIGRENDRQMVQSLGLYEDPALAAYIDQLGQKLAASSERADLEWTFRLVDDPVINAFALPGGFVYITRGILPYMNTEAELVSVIGHEIGHVTARHSVNQMSKQQLAQIGLFAGTVAAGRYGGLVQDLGGTGLGLAFLKFSRDDERQADDLGLRYIVNGGYDPRPMADIYAMLNDVSEASGAGRVPALFATHPEPEDRRERIESSIAAMGLNFDGRDVHREEFLAHINGIEFGPDPREGYFEGALFLHPGMKFRVDFPAGWRTANQRTVVGAISNKQDAMVQIGLAPKGTAQASLDAFFTQKSVARGPAWLDRINGLTARSSNFRASDGQQTLRGIVAMVEHEGQVFQIMALTPEPLWQGYEAALSNSVKSFKRLTDPKALAVQPQRIRIVKPSKAMDLATFAKTYDAAVDLKTLAVMNHLDLDGTVPPGRSYKVVTGGVEP